MLWVVSILTMVIGAVLAVVQTDVKRMLAYSSIAHTGFLLTGLLGVQAADELGAGEISSLEAVLFYLTTYGIAIVGSFALVSVVRDAAGETGRFDAWAGLGRRAPLTAGVFALFLLSMAGIPLTSGFIGKWAVFSVALSAGAWPVVVVAIGSSIVAVFFYVRFILLMFFTDRDAQGAASVTTPSALTSGVIGVAAVLTLLLGIVPGPVLDLVQDAGSFIR
jgi:NADH-quinone oxidoreductase subunit N